MNREGYIYIIKAETGHYKIGRTNNVPRRMNLFAVKLPFDFEIVHTFPCDDAIRAEGQLHQIFQASRIRGEWFNLANEDIEILKTIYRFSNVEEFQKIDQNNRLWGMPELWLKSPEWLAIQADHNLDRYSIYHHSMYGLPEIFYRIW